MQVLEREIVNAYALPGLKNNFKFKIEEKKVEDIFNVVLYYYGETRDDILRKCRKERLVHVRQVISFLIRRHTSVTLKGVADILGYKDHTTIVNSCRQIENAIDSNPRIRDDIKTIEAALF